MGLSEHILSLPDLVPDLQNFEKMNAVWSLWNGLHCALRQNREATSENAIRIRI